MANPETKQEHTAPDTCPVTGLPIVRRPEWTDIDLGDGNFTTFEFIGDRILLSRSKGWKNATRQSIKQLFQERRKVLDQMLDRNEPFVELRDYSHFKGVSSKESRDQFIAEMRKDKDRVIEFIGFNAPSPVKIVFSVWRRLFQAPFPITILEDYQNALEKAVAAARCHTDLPGRRDRTVVKFPQFTYASGTFKVEYEIIDQHIVHSLARGTYEPDHVGPSVENLHKISAHVEKSMQGCYFINGVRELNLSSYKTRLNYFEEIKQWHAAFPHFKMIIFYGADRWIKAGINLVKHMVPFKVELVDDLESAITHINVLNSTNKCHPEYEAPPALKRAAAPLPAYPGPAHEILEFLGNVSWEAGKPGIPDRPATADDSFGPVYDAISLIKMDLDELEENRRYAENERRTLATAIEQSTDSITITNAGREILYVNPAFSRITGYDQTEASGQPLSFISKDRDAIEKLDALWQDVSPGRAAKQQITCHKKNGSPYIAETTVSQISSSDGETRNFVTVQRDVTHEVQLEAQLKQIHKMEAIGTLAGGIAHDFNNILFPIIGYTEMSLDETEPDSQLAQNLREILQAATRAKQLVKQILTFSKQDSTTRKPIDLVPVIKEAVSLLRASIPATVEIRPIYQKNIGRVLADPTQIHQVIVNLGSNAFHAMREKGGVMTLSLKKIEITNVAGGGAGDSPGLPPGDYLKISISDTGHGMSPEISERIFEPFFTTKEMATNTGMGLSMIHGIVTGHDGRIVVTSEPGKGTTFDIFLPAIKITSVPEPDAPEMPPGLLPTGRGHILIVDDEIQSAKIIQKIVSKLGYDTTCFNNSRKALEFFRKTHAKVDLVITDLVMPRLTGDSLAFEMMKIRPAVPVIICTGHREMLNSTDTQKIRETLIKPVSRNDLAQAVQRALAST
jgi:PAS domain S-box-containing protein